MAFKIPKVNSTTIKRLYRFSKDALKQNAPTILTTFVAAGVVGTGVLTHRATLKAEEILRTSLDENASEETTKAVRRSTYKYYIPPIALGAATIGCAVGANYLNFKKITALAAACSVAETALNDQRDKIEELLGEKTLEKIDNSLAVDAKERATEVPIKTGHGNYLCCEGYLTGALFRADEDWIHKAVNEFNELVNANTYASFNDLLTCFHLHEVDYGNELGWNVHINGILRVRLTYGREEQTGEPYVVIRPMNLPVHNYADIL